MTARTYYIEPDGGTTNCRLSVVRQTAMAYLIANADVGGSVTVYASPTKKRIVGTVRLEPHGGYIYWWMETTSRGKVIETPIRADGRLGYSRI